METRSRRHAITDPGSAEHLPESSVTGSSSEETLNLTVMDGDRAAGDVGASHPKVGDSIRLPGTTMCLKKTSPAFLAVTRESTVGFSVYLAHMLPRIKQSIDAIVSHHT